MRISYSRVASYLQCGEYYRHYYLLHTPAETPLDESLLQGVLTHAGLERVLLQPEQSRARVLAEVLPRWLVEDCRLPVADLDVAALWEFGVAFGKLLYRASSRYRGEYGEAIRNKDGSTPKDLRNYPPGSWGRALAEQGDLSQLRLHWDNWAAAAQPFFQSTSFSFLLGRCCDWVLHFRYPDEHRQTLLVEYEFSPPDSDEQQVYLAGDVALNGRIDWVFLRDDDRLVVCDHKTSSQPPAAADVFHSPQLAVYAFAVHRLFGVWPDLVAIHHVPSGTYHYQAVDPGVVEQVLDYVVAAYRQMEQGTFRRRLPTEYSTPCVRRDYRTGLVVKTCPYLAHCWPSYYQALQVEGGVDGRADE